jgi:hypothetical protein
MEPDRRALAGMTIRSGMRRRSSGQADRPADLVGLRAHQPAGERSEKEWIALKFGFGFGELDRRPLWRLIGFVERGAIGPRVELKRPISVVGRAVALDRKVVAPSWRQGQWGSAPRSMRRRAVQKR